VPGAKFAGTYFQFELMGRGSMVDVDAVGDAGHEAEMGSQVGQSLLQEGYSYRGFRLHHKHAMFHKVCNASQH
jgi:hypothetical protein